MNSLKLIRIAATAGVVGAMLGAFGAAGAVLAAPPANDDPGGAVVIATIPFEISVDMSEATAGPEDPPSCQGDPAGMATVWYRLEPTFTTPRWIGVRASSVDTGTARVLAVASPGGALTVGCDGFEQWFLAQPGQSYWVVVQAQAPASPSGPITVVFQGGVASEAPPNDRSQNAVVVSSFPFHDDVDLAGATHSANDPTTCRGPLIEQGLWNGQTIWYRLDYPYAYRHRVGVRVSGSAFFPGFWVMTRPGGKQIMCADNPTGDGARGYFIAEPGHSYWIVVAKGENGHSVSDPVRVTIASTRIDAASGSPGTTLPDTSTADSASGVGAGSDDRDPVQSMLGRPIIPILIGGFTLAILLRRRPIARPGGSPGSLR